MREIAYAKLNLALHVRAREPDGYHRIETLFAFAVDGDLLEVDEGEDLSLTVTGRFAPRLGEGENLVMRAASALRSRHGVTRGAALLLDKRLPVASGIGGGSADAAAALRLLGRWWGLPPDGLAEIAAALGADVPACLASRTARGEGRGDRLSPVPHPSLAGAPVLLVNPGVEVPTGAVYAGWDGEDRGALAQGRALAAARAGRNDLMPPALALAPAIAAVLDRLGAQPGVVLARMSGSGATCFALFESAAARDLASAAVAQSNPVWWQLATRLR